MEIEELLTLSQDFNELEKRIIAEVSAKTYETYKKQYDPKTHDVANEGLRQNKIVETDDGRTSVAVNRVPVAMQKKIVGLAACFLCGNPVKISSKPANKSEIDILSVVQKTWDDNKLDYESINLAKIVMSETEVAELWYTEKLPPDSEYWDETPNQGRPLRLRMMILSNSNGNTLFPVFNNHGDMIAFGRKYQVKVEGKNVDHFDVYTEAKIYYGEKTQSGYTTTEEINLNKKIPVIYYSQPNPEWWDVQEMIDRYETSISNHGDTNDYNGSPITLVEGDIENFAEKGERGKVLKLKQGAKVTYLTWPQAPESIKLEQETLWNLMHNMTDTPDFSWDQMKGLGAISGVALKFLFLGAHMKAAQKETIIGKAFQRRLNFIKSAMTIINVGLKPGIAINVKPVFDYYLPKDDSAIIDMLAVATGAKPTLSQKTAIKNNPFVTDPIQEEIDIKDESVSAELQ